MLKFFSKDVSYTESKAEHLGALSVEWLLCWRLVPPNLVGTLVASQVSYRAAFLRLQVHISNQALVKMQIPIQQMWQSPSFCISKKIGLQNTYWKQF